MMMEKRAVEAIAGGKTFESFVAAPSGAGPRPPVLILPNLPPVNALADERAWRSAADFRAECFA